VRARLGVTLGPPALLLALIHRSAWNGCSVNIASTAFSRKLAPECGWWHYGSGRKIDPPPEKRVRKE
jgi:hypothetical protein